LYYLGAFDALDVQHHKWLELRRGEGDLRILRCHFGRRGDGVLVECSRHHAVEEPATGKPSTTDGALGDRRAADEKNKGHRSKRKAAP
jgi:hypothetical protein